MVKLYSDTATLSYATGGTYNTLREYTAGTTINHAINCRIQLNNSSYIIDENGDMVRHNYIVKIPFFDDYKDVPQHGANLRFGGNDHLVYQFWPTMYDITVKC